MVPRSSMGPGCRVERRVRGFAVLLGKRPPIVERRTSGATERRGSWLGAAPVEPVAAEASLLPAGVLGLDRHLKDMQLDVTITGPPDVQMPAEDGRRPPYGRDPAALATGYRGPPGSPRRPMTRTRLTPDLGVTSGSGTGVAAENDEKYYGLRWTAIR
jgi:hypothetical protein